MRRVGNDEIIQLIAAYRFPALLWVDQPTECGILKPQHELVQNTGEALLLQ